jgi:hypothetical protein
VGSKFTYITDYKNWFPMIVLFNFMHIMLRMANRAAEME